MNIEKIVLAEIGSLSTFENQIDKYAELREELFYDYADLYQLFGVILAQKQLIDPISIYTHATKYLKTLKAQDVGELIADVTSGAHLDIHIAQLKEAHYRKELERIIKSNEEDLKQTSTHDEAESQRNRLIADLSALELDSESEFINWTEHRDHIKDNLDKEKSIEGYSWGIRDLDEFTSGIMHPRLIVLGGLKKGGKSRFVINTRKELYNQNVPSVFLSLEMPAYEVVKLTYSAFLEINDLDLRSKNYITTQKKQEFLEMNLNTAMMPVECISRLDLDGVINRLRRYSKLYPNCVVFIDYLQRINHDRHRQAQELEQISQSIADATRAYDITVILLSQLANSAERDGVSTGSLKGSGGIGEAADIILLLDNIYRRTKNINDKNIIDIYIEQRYGDSGKVRTTANLEMCQFLNFAKEEDFVF